MCGIAGIFGKGWNAAQLTGMLDAQHHRGPDDRGWWSDPDGKAAIGQNRLSIIDLSPAGHQPMWNSDHTVAIVFNGEIYNYLELRSELHEYPYRSRTDTEVILAAYERWGDTCLEQFVGMFSFLLWDTRRRRLFAARDRFGVKPLYYHANGGALMVASEIKTIHQAGVEPEPDAVAWATYLSDGLLEHSSRTFWKNIRSLPPGHRLTWQDGRVDVERWYDIAERVAGLPFDERSDETVEEEYLDLLLQSVRLRFRSDVPVGINLSGGLDSSTLLGLVHSVQGADSEVKAYTFATGDAAYDETPWVRQMLDQTRHPSTVCMLSADEVPELAASVARFEDEPFGGIPTLAYARLFELARAQGTIVLLDGQGMDEQWAGYDYYSRSSNGVRAGIVQGADKPVRASCLLEEFRKLAEPFQAPEPFSDRLRNLQYRDIRFTKIPRALRFNDRVSMRSSTELREPFLDHRLFEIALRQPVSRKIVNGIGKWMMRRITAALLPRGIVEAPKRPLQTPQREWLRGPLRNWAEEMIEAGLAQWGSDWFDAGRVRSEWAAYCAGSGDNSFFVWQWIGMGLMSLNASYRRTVAQLG
jgi:asparagine synthase (glutamine-hydrolysing)